ncbi:MAG: hypothetical protein FJ040_00035 [Chloroflexi bacterium]|nr:hypothetical protein [Chloroflexota bacterium]
MDDYSRPKYLQSAHMTLTSGESLTITSPYGGPVQLWIAGTSTAETISVDFTNVGQHPVWDGADSTVDFTQRLELADYDWAEFLTPGFQIHSRRALMLETLQNADWNTPEKLATATMNSFYIANYNLAGFTGPSLSLSPTLETICDDMGWTCTGRSLHGITSMNHFNADQATCGYGCSGNPYDAWWAFDPLGWGDSHEMGHNIQRLHINNRNGSTATGEVSNNVFPSFVVHLWNRNFPSRYRSHAGRQQDIYYKGLVNAQKTASPYDAMSKMLWDGGTPTSSVISETDVDWGVYRLEFYLQLIQQARLNPTVKFGNGGWDLITMLYMADRLRENYDNDDTTWATHRTSLGMSTYTAAESRSIDNNSKLLLQVSWITKRDQRNFFTMWGINFDTKASNQVAAYGFPAAAKLFYYFPYDTARDVLWTTDAIGTLPVDSTTRTVPRVPLNFTITPNNTRDATYGTSMTLMAYVGASGTVNFKANGVTIPGCGAVATATRTADQPIRQ